MSLFSMSLSLFLFCKQVHLCHILDSTYQFSSFAQLCLTLCDPMDCMQHTRLHYPSPTPGACSNSCPSSRWCHPTISFSVVPFSSCLQSCQASRSFPKSQFFASGGQSWNFSFSLSPSNEYSELISFRIDWFDQSSRIDCKVLQSKGLSRVFSNTTV